MNHKETRWKQRYNNFIKAYRQLKEANDRFAELSVLEKEGIFREVVDNVHSKYFPAITRLIDYLEKEL